MNNTIKLPQPTLTRLTELIRQRDMVTALIDNTIATAREVLEVPDDWTISDVRVGFVGPEQTETPG